MIENSALVTDGLQSLALDDRQIPDLIAQHPGITGLTLISSNLQAFAARVLSARRAVRSLDLMYYTWNNDLTGNLLMKEVLAAAERGVQVRLLLDDIGVSSHDDLLQAMNAHPCIDVKLFNPTHAARGTVRRWFEMAWRIFSMTRRMHNKAWIADSQSAIIGGRNIGDAYFDAAEVSNFRDMDLHAIGPVVKQALDMFEAYWISDLALNLRKSPGRTKHRATLEALQAGASGAKIRPYLAFLHKQEPTFALGQATLHWCDSARLVSDPPQKALGNVGKNGLMTTLLPVLQRARHQVTLISPYFVPGRAGTKRIVALAQRHIEVSILTNSLAATDVAAVHGGYARYRRPLLQAGVRLFELRPTARSQRLSFRGKSHASLHTKAFSVDGVTGFIGSLNFDPRSTSLNTEMGVLFDAPDLVAEIDLIFGKETSPDISYALRLDGRRVIWSCNNAAGHVEYRSEPGASLFRQVVARLVGWLPLESQL